ncbi:MAG TPA: hypothetical protein DDX39_05305 [Bacteroidales bacterium]|nr:MAG: hypothetical protein A2W98_10875 [Bacteroidetes bacterium GWF2_33_38]OFY73919.1 MAG: hypothetical protein A2265_08480 [Bacteroidetes bacterium RIFOXYA12_FULL_33_9]OFY89293.1 MAG: hypothetical protein A2236_14185 [Bacteroidetes bacterium RIFOXYA2_FULL_33_7]HBF88041.1 hypothetical protein [Bacteroidales bacterium]
MNKNNVKFGLRKISTVQFATFDSVDIKEETIKLNVGFGYGLNAGQKILGLHTRFEFLSNETPFIILNCVCDFEIDSKTWDSFINIVSNTLTIPHSLAIHLAMITVGTARGILHSKTENTKFNTYFLPTINVADSIKTNIVLELQKQ